MHSDERAAPRPACAARWRGLLGIGGLACALLAGEAHAPAAAGKRHFEVATQDDGLFFQPGPARDKAFLLAREAGIKRLRTQMFWDQIGNDAGEMNFARFDEFVNAARAAGFKVQMTIVGAATWNPNGSQWVSHTNPNISHYKVYATAVATHFKGRVDRYSIWNEPNLHAFLRPQSRAHRIYRRLYRTGYKAIKSVDPKAKVLFGETSPKGNGLGTATDPLKFVRRVVRGQKFVADGYAHHPYRFENPPSAPQPDRTTITISDLRHLRRALTRLRKRGELKTPKRKTLPLYLTEFGYFVTGRRAISAAKRKAWMLEAYRTAFRKRSYVRQLLYYHFKQNPDHPWNTGLVSPAVNPTAQYEALKRWTCKHVSRCSGCSTDQALGCAAYGCGCSAGQCAGGACPAR